MVTTLGGAELILVAILAAVSGVAGPGFVVKLLLLIAFGWTL